MNRIILLLSLLITTHTFSQNIKYNSDSATYDLIDSSVRDDKFDIHAIAQSWITDNFKDSREIVRLDDADSGELIGKPSFRLSKNDNTTCTFTFKISTRENIYRCRIFDISITSGEGNNKQEYASLMNGDKKGKKTAAAIDARIRSLLSDLQKKMQALNPPNQEKTTVD